MMESAENLAAFRLISHLTGEMAEAARIGEWERVANLERQCAVIVANLKEAKPMQLPPDMQRQKVELIHKILGDDAEIRNYTEPWMRQVQTLLGNAGMARRVSQAYNPDPPG